jgi:hypothetical protein
LLSLVRFFVDELRCTRWPTTWWRWPFCGAGRVLSEGEREICDCDDDCLLMAVGRFGREWVSSADAMLTFAYAAAHRLRIQVQGGSPDA